MVEEAVLPGGSRVVFECGAMASQADGAALVRHGGNAVLATLVAQAPDGSEQTPPSDDGFVPLQVEYRERGFAAGRIPQTFSRREGAPRDREILACRVIDRSLRPRLLRGLPHELQLLATLISADGDRHADVCAINAAAAAAALSSVPFAAPVAAVRVALASSGEVVVDPDAEALAGARLALLYARAEGDRALMVEAHAAPHAAEREFAACLRAAHEAAAPLLAAQRRLMMAAAKSGAARPKRRAQPLTAEPRVDAVLRASGAEERLRAALFDASMDKTARAASLESAKAELALGAGVAGEEGVGAALEALAQEEVRRGALERGERVDGRKLDELRSLACAVGQLPGAHGDALFSRGDTQVLAAATVGGLADAAEQDHPVRGVPPKPFYLHYTMPPFATGEVGKVGGVGRREVGHGALAEKALAGVAPDPEDFPFAVRVSTEVLGSNGSSSMASVCGGSMALMDAGVPLREHVAGVSMGLVMDVAAAEMRADSKNAEASPPPPHALLTDIQGLEDGFGDMDWKLAGTREGITAAQLDIKPAGVPLTILEAALAPARDARLKMLDAMEAAIPAPRETVGAHAPRVEELELNADLAGKVVGLHGVGLRDIEQRSGAKLTLAHSDDGERVSMSIFAPNEAAMALARELVAEALAGELTPGKVVRAKVAVLAEYGAIVELYPTKRQGLVHLREISHEDIASAGDALEVRRARTRRIQARV